MILYHRYVPEIVMILGARPEGMRYKKLEGILKISDRTLTQRLTELEDLGLLTRNVDPGPPISVTYRLTLLGRTFVEPFTAWATAELAMTRTRIVSST